MKSSSRLTFLLLLILYAALSHLLYSVGLLPMVASNIRSCELNWQTSSLKKKVTPSAYYVGMSPGQSVSDTLSSPFEALAVGAQILPLPHCLRGPRHVNAKVQAGCPRGPCHGEHLSGEVWRHRASVLPGGRCGVSQPHTGSVYRARAFRE